MRSLPLLAVVCAWSLVAAEGDAKKRVAVFDFDNAAAEGGTTMVFFQTTAPNLGKAVVDQLVSRLVKNPAVSVIERAAIDKLIGEQNLSNSDRSNPATAARIGRILGVDGIVLGSITRYDYEDKTTGGGGGGVLGGFGRGGMNTKHDIRARVQITARLVSTDTAEVLSVAQGAGEVFKKGVKVDMRDMSRVGVMGSAAANNPQMNEAMEKAVAQLAGDLEQNIGKMPRHVPAVEGLVADANESGRLILNVGSRHGVKAGDRLQVWRPGKEIRDPATGKVLMRDDSLLGDAEVTAAQENASVAAYKGTAAVKTGDLVKSVPRQP